MTPSTITISGADAAADLAAYLTRLLRYDKAAAVRLVTADDVALVWGQPPFGVLTVKRFPLAVTPEERLDLTLSAGELLDAVPVGGLAAGPSGEGRLRLPRPLAGATAWRGFLPPMDGWTAGGTVPLAELESAAVAGIAEFKERAEAMPDTARTRAAVDALAAQIWDRELVFGPLRLAHAARSLGFLGGGGGAAGGVSEGEAGGGIARVASRGKWLRVDAPFGSVVMRDERGGGL